MKLVYGVGINDLPRGSCSGMVNGKKVMHPFYEKWKHMLERCYSPKCHQKHPTYIGCSVCEEWKILSKFKEWFDQQPLDRHSWQLDKDLLFQDNKVYSPETCILAPQWLNKFTTDCGSARGEYMIGSHWYKRYKKFRAQINDGCGNLKHLGYFTHELEAHLAWKSAKLQIVQGMKDKLDDIDTRVYPALIQRYK